MYYQIVTSGFQTASECCANGSTSGRSSRCELIFDILLFIVAGGKAYLWLELVSVFLYNHEDVSDAKQI